MKKILSILLLLVLFAVSASCGANTGESAGAGATIPTSLPDLSGIAPKEDIFGSITEIAGNLLEIKLAVMPEGGIPLPRRPVQFEVDADGNIKLPEGFTMPEGFEGRGAQRTEGGGPVTSFGGGEGPRVFGGGGAAPDGSISINSDTIRERLAESGIEIDGERIDGLITSFAGGTRNPGGMSSMPVRLEYTGEEIEFILPIGIPIYAVTTGEDGNRVETEIALTDIKNGNVISVTYKPDGKAIDKILVSQVTAVSAADFNPETIINNMQEAPASGNEG